MTVASQFPLDTPCALAFVGEAPSYEETAKGVPFVGPSGQIFDAILRTANVDRSLCYVGNVINEELPNNDVRLYKGSIAEQHARLAAELDMVSPTVIVPLGGTALDAFTGNSGITQARGAVQTATEIRPGAKLLPTLHPAFVMRQWKYYSVVVGDVIRACEEARLGPNIIWPDKCLELEPVLSDLEKWRDKLLGSEGPISLDIETGWGFITCIGFATGSDWACTIPFVDLRKPSRSYWNSPAEEFGAWMLVKEVLESNVPKLGQNFCGYDAYWLLAKMGIRTCNLSHDTRLLHHALYPELPKDLAFMGASYTRQGPWKLMRSRYRQEKKRDD